MQLLGGANVGLSLELQDQVSEATEQMTAVKAKLDVLKAKAAVAQERVNDKLQAKARAAKDAIKAKKQKIAAATSNA